ncbi:glycoside hydrolase [Podospora aff. communis PSN243]|uniref:alpha-1,2-Mannosidase n=1 Tax=Podospora aff. communis PSN243 TaxID=3040156 RepID=A0AAV9G9L5_9PEZI|nr:glycoside hydrolase [Podospora aff. communis PSN243]
MPRLPYQLRARRNALLSIALLITIIYYLSSSYPIHGTPSLNEPESLRLQRLMNQDARTSHRSASSFNWSSVPPKYPPGKLRNLPKGRPVSLPAVQFNFPPETPAAAKRREARRRQVRDLFRKNWASYRKYAWLKDALQPLSAGFKDQFSGWAATLVDSLDTLWIMGMREEFDEAVEAVAGIDFGKSSSLTVNMFETNIRYLGGLLAAYDLSGRPILLQKARELGDLLYAGFDTEKRMPVDFINFEAAQEGEGLTVEGTVVSASPGTLSMEMTRLSQLTGDPKYYDAVSRVMDVFFKRQEETRIPGLWPIYVSMLTPDVVSGSAFGIAGCADSLYEYLPKMHALLGGLDPKYEKASRLFMEAADKAFFYRPMLPGEEDLLMIGTASVNDYGDVTLDPESEHLGCFVGGIYGLGGRLFERTDWADDLGPKLTKGCIYAYQSMPTGMGPERWNNAPCKSRKQCKWDEKVFADEKRMRREWSDHIPKGFTTTKDPRYILRPEAIESVFVMYRVTGRQEYQEAAWDMFTAVANGTATPYANAAVLDVTKAEYPLRQEDYMESFWLAETLKYFYLALSPPDLISLDVFVLNTEAHPFRRPQGSRGSHHL